MLSELENIDDDCDQHNIAFVKISDLNEAKEYGIDTLPTLVLFERKIPHIYDGQSYEDFHICIKEIIIIKTTSNYNYNRK